MYFYLCFIVINIFILIIQLSLWITLVAKKRERKSLWSIFLDHIHQFTQLLKWRLHKKYTLNTRLVMHAMYCNTEKLACLVQFTIDQEYSTGGFIQPWVAAQGIERSSLFSRPVIFIPLQITGWILLSNLINIIILTINNLSTRSSIVINLILYIQVKKIYISAELI